MPNYNIYSASLAHHGVLGMKWGVRRYQNSDGSYTKKGLEHYRKAEAEYDAARSKQRAVKESYKSGKATKSELKQAKAETRNAKRAMSQKYDQLRKDKKADKGKALYSEGTRVETLQQGRRAVTAIAGIVGGTAMYTLTNTHMMTRDTDRNLKIAAIGSAAASAAWYVYTEVKSNELRAYYGHSRN